MAEAWANKAYCLSKLDRHKDAIACCESALAINPQLAPAWNIKARVEEGAGHRAAAIECYGRFIELASSDPEQDIEEALRTNKGTFI